MLVVQSILLNYCDDLLEYMKSIINRYLCNSGTSDMEVNNIMDIIQIIVIIFYIFNG